MNEIIDYIKDSPIEYAIDALSVNYVIQTIVQMVLFPFVLYFCRMVFKKILRNMKKLTETPYNSICNQYDDKQQE